MSYHEEGQVRLRRQRTKQAIALAMRGQWREAIAANEAIIESFPNDVDAYNRLGRAYMELGEYARARDAYQRAVELDPYNVIAKKNIDRLARLEETQVVADGGSLTAEPQHFIEEIGKAGVINLYHPGHPQTLVKMVAGEMAHLRVEGTNLMVENSRGEYLGQVEPRHSQRLIRLMAGGNKYSAAIISSTENTVTVIIREVYQDPSQAGQLSFPPRQLEKLRPYVGGRVVGHGAEYDEALLEDFADIDNTDVDYE